MTVQLQSRIKNTDPWFDINAEQFAWMNKAGYEIRALELVDVPKPTPAEPERYEYQFRWLAKKPNEVHGSWNVQAKHSHDLCVEQLTKGLRDDIQVRVVAVTQVGEIIESSKANNVAPEPVAF